jgi:hypothetical protein
MPPTTGAHARLENQFMSRVPFSGAVDLVSASHASRLASWLMEPFQHEKLVSTVIYQRGRADLEPHMHRLDGSKPNWRGRWVSSSSISSTPTEYSNTIPSGPWK